MAFPSPAVTDSVRLLAPCRCHLGEGPLWDDGRQMLFWTDIDAGELHSWTHATGEVRRVRLGDPVGGFTLEADGALALFRVNDLARLDPESGRITTTRPFADPGMKRFNDVTADFRGRVFAGTIGKDDQSGGLHRIDPDGRSRLLFRGTGVANGMGFSPDRGTFYWTCSTTAKIFAFAYDEAAGELSGRRVLHAADAIPGVAPDGLAVDREGCLWSARWGASCVMRLAPDGHTVIETVPVPAPFTTSCTFGGPGLATLFITTARQGETSEASPAGGVYAVDTATSGWPTRRSRIFC